MTYRGSMPGRNDLNGRQGLVNGNGLVNGHGVMERRNSTRGLVNGLGKVNGVGLTNGLTNGLSRNGGFVNGRGLVNGVRLPLRSNRFGIVTHKDLRIGVSLAVLFVLLLPSFYLILSVPLSPQPLILIDGDFSDWADVPSYSDDPDTSNANISITEYALLHHLNSIFMLVRVEGLLFSEYHGYDGLYAFIDADGNQLTGYWTGELGAEYAALVHGIDGKLRTTRLMRFASTADHLNWSGWKDLASIQAAFAGSSLEFSVPLSPMNLEEDYSVRIAATDFQGNMGLSSLRIGKSRGALQIIQSARSDFAPLTPQSSNILHVDFISHGLEVEISDFRAMTQWQWYPADLMNRIQLPNMLIIATDQSVGFDIFVNLTGLSPETPVWLNLTRLQTDVPVTIHGDGGVGYVERLPAVKKIDGWFGDWQQGLNVDSAPPNPNPNIDIESYASNVTRSMGDDHAFFFVELRGKAFGGSFAPADVIWVDTSQSQPSPPGPPRPSKRVAGEDTLTFFIDTNASDRTGCHAHGMLANYKIEIIGHQRKIDSKGLYECVGGTWVKVSGVIPPAMTRAARIEASIDLRFIGPLDQPEVLIEATDWSGKRDIPPPIDVRTRGSTDDSRTRSSDLPVVYDTAPGLQEIFAPPLSQDPNRDGRCDDSVYINEATHVTNTSYEFYIGHRNANWVWVCVRVYDSTNENLDLVSLLFDSKHNHTDYPQVDDRRFTLQASGGSLIRQRGNGSAWVDCDITYCSPGDNAQWSFYLNNQTYEFRINAGNVWNSSGQIRAGFAIIMFDANGGVPRQYIWGSWIVDRTKPSTWGHLDIPEFPILLMPFLIAAVIPLFRRKRARA